MCAGHGAKMTNVAKLISQTQTHNNFRFQDKIEIDSLLLWPYRTRACAHSALQPHSTLDSRLSALPFTRYIQLIYQKLNASHFTSKIRN